MAEDDYQMAHVVVDLESVILIFSNYIYALLTKREVKKAGYWPSSFLPLSDSKMTLRSIKRPKRTSYLDRTSLVKKGFILWPKRELVLSGMTWEILSGQDGLILPAQVTNQNRRFASSCLLVDLTI